MHLRPYLILKHIICNILILFYLCQFQFAAGQESESSNNINSNYKALDSSGILGSLEANNQHSSNYNDINPIIKPIISNSTIYNTPPSQNFYSPRRAPKVCPGLHIRNDLKQFERLKGCNIIDGPVTIALVSNQTHPYEPKDYENITFPELYEVTEYLLFFRVQGLSSLSTLFPNLAVIRGKELVSNYALIIYEMMHLQKINLLKLTDILRGSVRIESNPNLCHVSTVNWEGICKHVFTPHFIKDNNKRCNNHCPDHCRPWTAKDIGSEQDMLQGDVKELGAENNRSLFCWNSQICHESCQTSDGLSLPMGPNGGCCSAQCAGGCSIEGRSDQCLSCRSVSQEDKCVEHCDHRLYEYKGSCISEQACLLTVEPVQRINCTDHDIEKPSPPNLKAVRIPTEKHGRCQATCPPGYEEDPTYKNKCKPCDKGKCRKVCTPPQTNSGQYMPFMVTNVDSLRELSGCNIINGSLEISMKGGKNVLDELEKVFIELDEIKGYLKITRSYPILTLGFLSTLKAINGSELDREQYSLIIIDNPNLQELFMFNTSHSDQKPLNILNGKIFVHLNPKLCPHRIDNLKTYATVADWDSIDVSAHTNGDKEACNTEKLEVIFERSGPRKALIKFQNFAKQMNDTRALLYYLINYREVSNGSVTMFDGRDGCNSQNDLWTTVEQSPITYKTSSYSGEVDDYQSVTIDVKPSTRYALYVKTFTILTGSTGALSDLIYFQSAPDTPSIPKQIESSSISPESVVVSWSPPSRPNGVIDSFIVTITRAAELEDFQNIDICDSINDRDKITQSLTREEPNRPPLIPEASTNSNSTGHSDNSQVTTPGQCLNTNSNADVDLRAEVVTFQDMIIDIIYLKKPEICVNNHTKTIKKRSIEFNAPPITTTPNPVSMYKNSQSGLPIAPNSTKFSAEAKNLAPTIPIIKYDKRRSKVEVNITADRTKPNARLTYSIVGLEHFSLYTIEVVACHAAIPSDLIRAGYHRCSIQAITQVRTQAIEQQDRVLASTMEFRLANETFNDHIVTWKKPDRPNGLVLAYRVRYRLKNGNPLRWTIGCVNNTVYMRDGGYTLNDIGPGLYLFQVQTVSMYTGQTYWTEPELIVHIPQNYLVSPPVLISLTILAFIFVALAVASGTYFYQKRRHERLNDILYASVNPDYEHCDPDEWEVDKKNLLIGQQIGTGSFGLVYKGQLITEEGVVNCAVKTVPPTSTAKQRIDFLREATYMKQFNTFHVVRLMGVVSSSTPVYVIMEYMENGDLKSFLRRQREMYQKENKPLVDGIYLMAAQIADGMAYLASQKFVHRDLAARNCMVNEHRTVKIADFGLTRDIYANDYYRRDTQDVRLPVRWMAPESLKDNLYTSASDVWSYGIVVWEMVTFASYPYQGMSNEEVIRRVVSGHRMDRPDNCPDKLYKIIESCWKKDFERPTFIEIVEVLLPETENKLLPDCFYREDKAGGDNITSPDKVEGSVPPESYPMLPLPPNRINGLTNGYNHIHSIKNEKKILTP